MELKKNAAEIKFLVSSAKLSKNRRGTRDSGGDIERIPDESPGRVLSRIEIHSTVGSNINSMLGAGEAAPTPPAAEA